MKKRKTQLSFFKAIVKSYWIRIANIPLSGSEIIRIDPDYIFWEEFSHPLSFVVPIFLLWDFFLLWDIYPLFYCHRDWFSCDHPDLYILSWFNIEWMNSLFYMCPFHSQKYWWPYNYLLTREQDASSSETAHILWAIFCKATLGSF